MFKEERAEIVDLAPFFLIVGNATSSCVSTFSFEGEEHKEILLLWKQLFNHTPISQKIFSDFLYEMHKASIDKEYHELIKDDYQEIFTLSNPFRHLLPSFTSIKEKQYYNESLYKNLSSYSSDKYAQENSITTAFIFLGNLLSAVAEQESNISNVKDFWDKYLSSWNILYLQFLYDHSKLLFWKIVFMSSIIALERLEIELNQEDV